MKCKLYIPLLQCKSVSVLEGRLPRRGLTPLAERLGRIAGVVPGSQIFPSFALIESCEENTRNLRCVLF